MALNPSETFPGQTNLANLAAYPFGAAQNAPSLGSGTGTPLEERIVNDIFGFQQSLLAEAGISPNNSPDSVTNPQYRAALEVLFYRRALVDSFLAGINAAKLTQATARFQASASALASNAQMTLTQKFASPGIVLNADEVELSMPGRYLFTVRGSMTSASTNNGVQFGLTVRINGGNDIDDTLVARVYRFSTTTAQSMPLRACDVLEIADPPNQKITVTAFTTDSTVFGLNNQISIMRVGDLLP